MQREALATLAGAAVAWPLAARGQESEKRGIVYLAVGTRASVEESMEVFRHELQVLGYSGEVEIR